MKYLLTLQFLRGYRTKIVAGAMIVKEVSSYIVDGSWHPENVLIAIGLLTARDAKV